MVAGAVGGDDALDAADELRDGEPPGQHDEERWNLALLNQPIVRAQIDVGRARRDDFELAFGDSRQKRDCLQLFSGNHASRVAVRATTVLTRIPSNRLASRRKTPRRQSTSPTSRPA